MMPIRSFGLDLAGLLLCLMGFAFLALAAAREGHVLLHRDSRFCERLIYRLLGWLFLVTSLSLAVYAWHGNFGTFLWIGWLTVSALVVVFFIAYWPWRSKRHTHMRRLRSEKYTQPLFDRDNQQIASWQRGWRNLLLVALVALPVSVAWSVHKSPLHPLLRDDAVQGHVGPWSFTLAEEEMEGPEPTPSGVLIKHLMLRFCDSCDAEIRAAYVQLRKPSSSPRSRGIRFVGVRWEREATVPVPTVITPQDRLWITAVDKDGQVYRVALDVAKVSPALARHIAESSQ